MKVAIVGGGAAGFFAAIQVKENYPDASVCIIEKTAKVLAKVRISGGGRCNVTNGTKEPKDLIAGYPRGQKLLKRAFRVFNNHDTMAWFHTRNVPLYTQDDLRVFPLSDTAESIINCLLEEVRRLNIEIILKKNISNLLFLPNGKIELSCTEDLSFQFEKVIITTGGSPSIKGFNWLAQLGHRIEPPVPSLFTFNMPDEPIRQLMGVVCQQANVSIQGTRLKADGSLLITHWGMSGPAILKLSALGARALAEREYTFIAQVNWTKNANYQDVTNTLHETIKAHPKKIISNIKPFLLPNSLWIFLLEKAEISLDKKWNEISKKSINKLTTILINDEYQVKGKTTFKEEFVTCGGVSLSSINHETLASKIYPNLYFAGEVLDIDGITGGYNFQAAWTTGFIAGKLG